MTGFSYFTVPSARGNLLPFNKWTTRLKNPPALTVNENGALRVGITDSKHLYLVAGGTVQDFLRLSPSSGVPVGDLNTVYVDSDVSLFGAKSCRIAILEFDENRARIGEIWVDGNRAARLILKDETKFVLFALRLGPGKDGGAVEIVSLNADVAESPRNENSASVEYSDSLDFAATSLPDVYRRLGRASGALSAINSDFAKLRNQLEILERAANTASEGETKQVKQEGWKNHPSVDQLIRSKIFHWGYYALISNGFFQSEKDAASHFLSIGMAKMHACNPLLDPKRLPTDIQKFWKQGNLTEVLKYLRQPRRNIAQLSDFFDPKSIEVASKIEIQHEGGCLGWYIQNTDDFVFLPTEKYAVRWGDFKTAFNQSIKDHLETRELTRDRLLTTWDLEAENAFKNSVRACSNSSNKEELISIIMPSWNRANIISEAIASVQKQTYANWELLIVDDGSSDETAAIVATLQQNDPRIKFYPIEHQGVCAARNVGIKEAQGKYLAFLDSDNKWQSDFLEIMVLGMLDKRIDFAYAGLQLESETGTTYRAYSGGTKALRIFNHIDLNILVVATSLARQINGFDGALRRWVDHDFALRLSEIVEPVLFPIIGCIYDNASGPADRITNSEPDFWQWKVLEKAWVDWNQQPVSTRVQGRVSVVMPMYGQHQLTEAAIRAVLDTTLSRDVEIVVVDNGSPLESTWRIATIFSGDSRVKFVRLPRNLNFSTGSNYGAANSTGEYVLFLNNDTEVRGNWLDPLLERIQNPEVAGVQPLLLFPDDSIQSAGTVFAVDDALPVPFLVGLPRELGSVARDIDFQVVTAAALLMRSSEFAEFGGFDASYVNGMEDVDLCLRMSATGKKFVVEPSSIVHHHESKTPGRGKNIVANRLQFIRAWKGRLPKAQPELWKLAGLRISDVTSDGHPIPGPKVQLERVRTAKHRWGIKYSANGGPRGDSWGDTYFVDSLRESLERLGAEVTTYRHGANVDYSNAKDDVNLVIRGIDRVAPIPGQINILWIISHPEDVTVEEVCGYDLVYAASEKWAKQMEKRSRRSIKVLHQATDITRFNTEIQPDLVKRPATFVGSVHAGRRRRIVEDALTANVPLCVIGGGWRDRLNLSVLERDSVDNKQLAAVYRSASRVLADHWYQMAEGGFIQNRLFDAVAAGCRVITDPVEGVDSLFGGAVQSYESIDQLRYLCSEDGIGEFPSDTEIDAIAKRVRQEHSFDARAKKLIEDAKDLG